MPPIFHIDSYEDCLQKNKHFCRASLKLYPSKTTHSTKVWNLIQETKRFKTYYNHDELYHAICINDSLVNKNSTSSLKTAVTKMYAQKYEDRGLTTEVVTIECENLVYRTNTFDISLLCFIVIYLILIILATAYHIKTNDVQKISRCIIVFSIYYNLTKLYKMYRHDNFQKLHCIQSIRFFTTVLVIFCHTFCSFAGGYIANTKYLEDIPSNVIRHSIRILFVFLVQTFFLISAWLLSYNTFTIFKNTKNINVVKYTFVTIVNRYLRIIPPVLLMVCLGRSVWIYGTFSGPVKNVYSDKEYQRCQKNWWIVLLFLSNHYQQHEMCYFTAWYLSADTQLYVLSLLFLTLMLKFKQLKIFLMILCLLLGIIIPSVVSYLYNLDTIYRINPENAKNNGFLSFEFSATYTSTYSNMATYTLGLIFGYVYFRVENKVVFKKNIYVLVCWTLATGLPLLIVMIPAFEYGKITSTILAGILKPLYAFGIGLGIFGMLKDTGGWLKKLCSWKPFVFFGNFTYTTYVVHFGIVFYRTASTRTPIYISDYNLFVAFLQDVGLSFICGFIVHLLLEMPLSQLQHIFVFKFSVHKAKHYKKRETT
ncbi:O-acyltransferase like protein-like [Zophobas morio]|uniref:O-acyltransferase like protein-like n=1 Tax=Zophobas morio TaxID=2755281 RepID=UPI003082FDAC